MPHIPKTKAQQRARRHDRIRARLAGTSACPRLNVFRSLRGMFVQLIDDQKRLTIASVSSKTIKPAKVEGRKAKVAMGFLLGQALAAKAKELGITQVVFDRGGYGYHGRVAAVAEGARAGGLKF